MIAPDAIFGKSLLYNTLYLRGVVLLQKVEPVCVPTHRPFNFGHVSSIADTS